MASNRADRQTPAPAEHVAQLLLDAIGDYAIYMIDPDGRVLSWNAGAQKLHGYEPAEIIGQDLSHLFTADDQAHGTAQEMLAEVQARGRTERETWRVRKDGSEFRASSVLTAIHDPSGRVVGFAEVTRDITEQSNTQARLVESERRFRLLVESVTDYAIYMLDPGGLITNWNSGAQRMTGYAAHEAIGRHFSRFYGREDRAAGAPLRALEIASREGRYEAEGWRYRKDGGRFWASVVLDAIRDEQGELLGFAKITRDITERRAAQDALRDSERQFRLLVAGVTDYALFMLDPNGIVASWNAGAERIKGYTASEIVGQHFSRFYTETDRQAGLPVQALYTATHEGRFEAEAWRVRKDGSTFWANVIIDAIRDDAGHLIGFAKITRDITERRKAQIALQEAQAQRAHAQKMEALGQLTGGVAHDFNNLLMVVGGYVRTLRKLVGDDPKGARAVEAIELAAKQGESLTRQLLSFSRRQPVSPRIVSLGERIDAVRTMLASSTGSTIKVITNVPPDIWRVRVDVNEFELALLNLTLNARDAMAQSGVITITAENATLGPSDTPDGLRGDFVAVTVADTGAGIPPDVLPRIFEPFFTTKRANKGSGLGLAQVHGFSHQSGGAVTVQSELGKGTQITLYLPRVEAHPDKLASEAEAASAGSGTALLVEDNPDVAEVSADLLRELGYQVRIEDSAQAALSAIEDEKFDIVISDIVMPGEMDGLALAKALRRRHPDLPIVLVTGYSSALTPDIGFTVMRKPFQLGDLSRALAKAKNEPGPTTNLVHLNDARRPPKPDRP